MTSRLAAMACAIVLAGLACLPAAVLEASVIIPAGLRTLAVEAQSIVYGRVIDVRARVRPGTRRIDSFVVFAVDDVVKGPSRASVVFRTLGGESGRYRTIVPGSPQFRAGDEAVIFLGRGTLPYPIGLSHGVFRVRRDARTGERRVLPPPMLLDPKHAMTVRRADGTRVPLPVERFLAMVRRAAAEQP